MGEARGAGWLGGLLLSALLLLATHSGAHAQADKEYQDLEEHSRTLGKEGRYAEGTETARRALTVAEQRHGPDHLLVSNALYRYGQMLVRQSRLKEAEPVYLRSLAIREKARGPDHTDVAQVLNSLGFLYRDQSRFGEADTVLKRALEIREKVHGPDHVEVAQLLINLAVLYRFQGRYADAEPHAKRALAIREAKLGPDDAQVANSLAEIARIYSVNDRIGEAETLLNRALAIHEKASDPDLAGTLVALASLYRQLGRFTEAEPLLIRGLSIRERALGANHPSVASSLASLAEVQQVLGRYVDAETNYKRALNIQETARGPESLSVGSLLDSLGRLYRTRSRFADAEPLIKRALMIREKTLGAEDPAVARTLDNLAELYRIQRRLRDAEPLYLRAIAIMEKAPRRHHRQLGNTLVNLGELYRLQGRLDMARPLYERGLKIHEETLDPAHPDIGVGLTRLANLNRGLGRLDEAEMLLKRALANRERAYGPDHPAVAFDLGSLAHLAFTRGEWTTAADYWRRSTSIIIRRAADSAENERGDNEALLSHGAFRALVKAAYRAAGARAATDEALARETFDAAQWAQGSEAAASIAQMAARGASNDPGLGWLVRERQDLIVEWRAKDKQLIAAKSLTPDMRKPDAEAALSSRLMAIDKRVETIDALFAKDYPDYAGLASTKAISAAEVQVELRGDEALVLFLDAPEHKPAPEETFIWVVTRNQIRLVQSEMGNQALTREVAALRCGLDSTAWTGTAAERCAALLGIPRDRIPTPGTPLPFDAARAHKLYVALFGKVHDLIRNRHLLIVPSGPLAQLPFQVLASRAPSGGDMRSVRWLARDHAITVLPAAASLKSLRRIGRPSSATLPMIGFGNPLLDGPDDRYGELAKLARDTQKCPDTRWRRRNSTVTALRRSVDRVASRGGLADPAHLKSQTPLPETADELCAVARDVRGDARDLRLGARATEREVKHMSARGDLARYRIVHFATHATLAGQLMGASDPGLILTPPGRANQEDDGYLSAPEIAGLKLDADWVILSACNTAAGNPGKSEALSGLARAFIYAGARALLVSHWAVDSDATVKLITSAVREMSQNPRVGRAEALRRASLALIDEGAPHEAHPAYWAPFVVVGEGAPQN